MILNHYDYMLVLILLLVSIGLGVALYGVSYILADQKIDKEKVSAYECGFDPFSDSRSNFDVHFYLVAILFIIFDLEVAFLFPWSLVLADIGLFGFWTMFIFLLILTVGFIYEWKKGALDWE